MQAAQKYAILFLILTIKFTKRYNVIGILDDNLSLKGKMVNDLPVLGSLSCSEFTENDSIKFIFAIGQSPRELNVS